MMPPTPPVAKPEPSSFTKSNFATRDEDAEALFQQQPDGAYRIVMDRYAVLPLEWFDPEHPRYDSTQRNLADAVARMREGKAPFATWEETYGSGPIIPGGGAVTVGGAAAI